MLRLDFLVMCYLKNILRLHNSRFQLNPNHFRNLRTLVQDYISFLWFCIIV